MREQLTTFTPPDPFRSGCPRAVLLLLLLGAFCGFGGGCATIRVTDPPHTATEQFLMTVAAQKAISQLSVSGLRDRFVFIDPSFAYVQQQPSAQDLYTVAELRARLLSEGVRLTANRQSAEVIVEVRVGAIGVDRREYLLGLPSVTALGQGGSAGAAAPAVNNLPLSTPELALLKSTKQRGYVSVAIVAYRVSTGELISQSGPFVGRTVRDDFFVFGVGLNPVGNIPTTEEK